MLVGASRLKIQNGPNVMDRYVPKGGVEPPRARGSLRPERSASTSSTTSAVGENLIHSASNVKIFIPLKRVKLNGMPETYPL